MALKNIPFLFLVKIKWTFKNGIVILRFSESQLNHGQKTIYYLNRGILESHDRPTFPGTKNVLGQKKHEEFRMNKVVRNTF